ncbi:hypothetical protein V8C42DRAFT_331480 [Trichoderma barbatum]
MADYTIYTRAYSESSAGKLTSAKRPTGDALTHIELLDEFRNHAKSWSKEPTALISVSNRIIDTIRRAFEKYYTHDELPGDIWIAFIKVPTAVHESATSVHAAQSLAEECEYQESEKFQHEFIFEWKIPDEYVLHQVSLQTLIDRGLDWRKHLIADGYDDKVVSTSELRSRVAMDFQSEHSWQGGWETGMYLGDFARKFGARAPLDWVARQLFYDCTTTKISDEVVVRIYYACDSSITIDFDFFWELDGGVENALYELWLADLDFYLNLNEFEEWRDAMEAGIIEDEFDFWDTWTDEILGVPPGQEALLRNEAWVKLATKHKDIRSAIEEQAVKIGL